MRDAALVEAGKRELQPEGRLIVLVAKESDGYTFSLHPLSAKRLRRTQPKKPLPTISVAYDVRADFEQLHASLFEELIPVLTGLGLEAVRDLGGLAFLDARSNQELFALPGR